MHSESIAPVFYRKGRIATMTLAKIAVLVTLVGTFGTIVADAQVVSTVPPVNTFTLTATPLALPSGQSTFMGTDAGFTFTPTQNFDLREDNLVAPSANFTAFFGGFNYRLPVLSTKLNNVSPNLNGYRFQFYITASAGVDRIAAATTREHYSFLAGGGVQYDLTGSGTWTLGGEVRYAKLPGLANNTAIVTFGPSIHF
jgi:hypothetical protein